MQQTGLHVTISHYLGGSQNIWVLFFIDIFVFDLGRYEKPSTRMILS